MDGYINGTNKYIAQLAPLPKIASSHFREIQTITAPIDFFFIIRNF